MSTREQPAAALGEDAVDLITQLVSVPSPSGGERAASQLLVDWMSANGLDARVDEVGNAIGVKGTGRHEILLLGHIDTFPGDVPVRREGDRLYGRGSVDAKGPLCAFGAALTGIDVPTDWRVTVVGAVEEEAATSRGARHVLRERSGTPPRYCVIGEPSRWDRVTVGYRGRLLLDVTLRVPQSHSAGPERSPAERGVAAWQAVEVCATSYNAKRGERSSMFESLSPSLRTFTTRPDGAYGVVDLGIGFRLPLSLPPDELERQVIHTLGLTCFGDHGPFVEVSDSSSADGRPSRHYRLVAREGDDDGRSLECLVHGHEYAFRAGKSNPLVRAFLSAIRVEGGTPRFVTKSGTSDMNVVGPAWPGVAMLAYGPGDSALDHTPWEHLDVREYLRAIAVLRRVLEQLMM